MLCVCVCAALSVRLSVVACERVCLCGSTGARQASLSKTVSEARLRMQRAVEMPGLAGACLQTTCHAPNVVDLGPSDMYFRVVMHQKRGSGSE